MITAIAWFDIPVIHIGNAEAQKGDTFTDNTYKAGTLKVEKQVKGTQGNKSKDFAFTLTLTGEEAQDLSGNWL